LGPSANWSNDFIAINASFGRFRLIAFGFNVGNFSPARASCLELFQRGLEARSRNGMATARHFNEVSVDRK
jgi:hypothetical protein